MTQFVYCSFTAFRKMEDIGWTNFELNNDMNNNVLVAANTMSEIARLYAGKGMILRNKSIELLRPFYYIYGCVYRYINSSYDVDTSQSIQVHLITLEICRAQKSI